MKCRGCGCREARNDGLCGHCKFVALLGFSYGYPCMKEKGVKMFGRRN